MKSAEGAVAAALPVELESLSSWAKSCYSQGVSGLYHYSDKLSRPARAGDGARAGRPGRPRPNTDLHPAAGGRPTTSSRAATPTPPTPSSPSNWRLRRPGRCSRPPSAADEASTASPGSPGGCPTSSSTCSPPHWKPSPRPGAPKLRPLTAPAPAHPSTPPPQERMRPHTHPPPTLQTQTRVTDTGAPLAVRPADVGGATARRG